jgi:3-dehydroquinate dehydratase-2
MATPRPDDEGSAATITAVNILMIHGPNLNLLGTREPNLYGTFTLNEIDARLQDIAQERDRALRTTQSNSEGVLIDVFQDARA